MKQIPKHIYKLATELVEECRCEKVGVMFYMKTENQSAIGVTQMSQPKRLLGIEELLTDAFEDDDPRAGEIEGLLDELAGNVLKNLSKKEHDNNEKGTKNEN